MREFERKKKIYRIFYSKVTLLILLILLAISIKSTWNIYKKYKESKEYIQHSRQELTLVTERQKELESKVEELHTEKGIEKEIRTNFNVAKEGEQVIIIVPDESKEEVPAVSKKGFLGKMWEGFTAIFK